MKHVVYAPGYIDYYSGEIRLVGFLYGSYVVAEGVLERFYANRPNVVAGEIFTFYLN